MLEQETTKLCGMCKQIKSLDNFYMRKGKKGNLMYRSECKACNSARCLAWARNNPEKARAKRKRRDENLKQDPVRYARYLARHRNNAQNAKLIDRATYNALLEQQKDVCAICGKSETVKDRKGGIRALAIDHDHTTGRIRGLLCFRCNTSLAILENGNIERLQAYLGY